jgi:hypothetical protein
MPRDFKPFHSFFIAQRSGVARESEPSCSKCERVMKSVVKVAGSCACVVGGQGFASRHRAVNWLDVHNDPAKLAASQLDEIAVITAWLDFSTIYTGKNLAGQSILGDQALTRQEVLWLATGLHLSFLRLPF